MSNTQAQTNAIIDLTLETFRSAAIDNPEPILIDFWAPWCGPCRMMKPILDETAVALAGVARVAKVNIDEEPAIADAFGIQSIPTLVLIKEGKLLDAVAGVMPASALVSRVKAKVAK